MIILGILSVLKSYFVYSRGLFMPFLSGAFECFLLFVLLCLFSPTLRDFPKTFLEPNTQLQCFPGAFCADFIVTAIIF